MDDEPTVDCALHGTQAVSFVCTHIAHGLLDETTPGFVIWGSEAWRSQVDFKLLCGGCYGEAKGCAISANRFHNLRPAATPRG